MWFPYRLHSRPYGISYMSSMLHSSCNFQIYVLINFRLRLHWIFWRHGSCSMVVAAFRLPFHQLIHWLILDYCRRVILFFPHDLRCIQNAHWNWKVTFTCIREYAFSFLRFHIHNGCRLILLRDIPSPSVFRVVLHFWIFSKVTLMGHSLPFYTPSGSMSSNAPQRFCSCKSMNSKSILLISYSIAR